MQALDVPFIEYEWNMLIDVHKNSNVLGRYLAKMNLRGFRDYTYEDSNFLNELYKQRKNGQTS